ncbi:hypothetical protein ANO14919_094340 [Xylariales sp. No.14919]|nr:hypothetical protein ANO14919_094340 [Xylariales sp. No.14919]
MMPNTPSHPIRRAGVLLHRTGWSEYKGETEVIKLDKGNVTIGLFYGTLGGWVFTPRSHGHHAHIRTFQARGAGNGHSGMWALHLNINTLQLTKGEMVTLFGLSGRSGTSGAPPRTIQGF